MSSNVFYNLNSASDLYEKCKYEFIKISDTNCNNDSIYSLFNLILSLNHLLEWFLTDKSINDLLKEKCIKQFYPYRNQKKISSTLKYFIKLRRLSKYNFITNENQELLRKISNQIKHIKTKKIDTSIDTSFTVTCGDNKQCGDGHQCGEYKYIYYVNSNNRDIDLLLTIQNLLNEWNNLFNTDSV